MFCYLVVNEYYDQGLRMIEIYKHQFKDLSNVIAQIKNRNYRFIIYMDDLSFEEFEIEYKFLKAVIEGGVETKPENILIYATSNRRHLIKETWNDRSDVENSNGMHRYNGRKIISGKPFWCDDQLLKTKSERILRDRFRTCPQSRNQDGRR